jgi:hypothetical protein
MMSRHTKVAPAAGAGTPGPTKLEKAASADRAIMDYIAAEARAIDVKTARLKSLRLARDAEAAAAPAPPAPAPARRKSRKKT